MKLKELQEIFESSNGILKLKFDTIPAQQNQPVLIQASNLITFRNNLISFEKSNLFNKEIDELKNSALFTTKNDDIKIQHQEGSKLQLKFENFKLLFTSFQNLLNDLIGETRSNVISVKLPKLNDLEGLANAANIFHKIFSQAIINDKINGEIKIDNVENGSIWLDIFLGTTAAVTLIGNIVWSAAVIYKKIQEGRMFAEHVNSLKIKNESLEDIRVAQQITIDLMIESEAKHIFSENFGGDDNEQIERLKNSIKLLSDQIDKGAEIHPALSAPEDVKNLFPKTENFLSLESKIKKLTN
jgi:hypothetical protein